MANKQKQSVSDFISDFRQQVDVPEGMSDSQLMQKLMGNEKVRAKIKDTVALSQSTKGHKNHELTVGERFMKAGQGAAEMLGIPTSGEQLAEMDKAERSKGMGQTFVEGLKSGIPGLEAGIGTAKSMWHEAKRGAGQPGLAGVVDRASAVNPFAAPIVDRVRQYQEQGEPEKAIGAGGAGAIGLALGLGKAPEAGTELAEAQAVGKGRLSGGGVRAKAANQVAELANQPSRTLLDSQIEDIDKAMAHQYVDSQRLSAGIAHAKNVIKRIKSSPSSKTIDVTAARDAVERLETAVKNNPKHLPWADARQHLQELNASITNLKPAIGKTMMGETQKALEGELRSTAKPVMGDIYDKWSHDWHRYKNNISNHQKAILDYTPEQMQHRPKESMLKRYTRLGRSVADKKAAMANKKIGQANRAATQLHAEIKARDRAKPPAQPGQPGAPGAPGGAAPAAQPQQPQAGAQAAQPKPATIQPAAGGPPLQVPGGQGAQAFKAGQQGWPPQPQQQPAAAAAAPQAGQGAAPQAPTITPKPPRTGVGSRSTPPYGSNKAFLSRLAPTDRHRLVELENIEPSKMTGEQAQELYHLYLKGQKPKPLAQPKTRPKGGSGGV